MYKLMVVDDEPFIADGLAELFEQMQEPSFEVFVAYTPQSALEKLDRIRMDIVISDIKMPKMTGIEMLKQVKERWPFCHVIFLSGYDDFEYVQSALEYGADSYLLKSQPDEGILDAVIQTIEKIKKENAATHLQKRITAEYEYVLPFLQKDFIARLLNSSFDGDVSVLQDRLASLRISLSAEYPVMLIGGRIDNMDAQASNFAESQALIDAVFMEYITPKANSVCHFCGRKHLFWLVQKKLPHCEDSTLCSYLTGMLEQIQYCCKQINLPISFVWDSRFYTWEQLSVAYERISSIVTFLLDPESEMILCDTNYFQSNLANDSIRFHKSQTNIIDEIQTAFEGRQKDLFLVWLDKILFQISDHTDPMCQMTAYHSLCALFLDLIERTGQKIEYLRKFGSFSIFTLPQSKWHMPMIQKFREIGLFLFDEQGAGQKSHFHQIIQTLHQYISAHLADDLTLATLAAQVYLNPVYLSRAYRQATGQKLSEYVLESRIREAKKMLQDRTYKINEIAFAVGFESAAHFSRVFKKQTSLTPLEYRDNTSK